MQEAENTKVVQDAYAAFGRNDIPTLMTHVADDIWPGDKGYYSLGGHWWASPIAVETRALYYRKDLFKAAGLDPDKPPANWEELAAAADKVTKAGGGKYYGIALPMSLERKSGEQSWNATA